MGLPITEYPLTEIYVHSLKEKVDFRPFLVKEEKLLVLASESNEAIDMVKASQQIVTNCSFGKVEGDKIPIFDMQNIFIELRKMSVGDTVEAVFACGECGEKNTVIIDRSLLKLPVSYQSSFLEIFFYIFHPILLNFCGWMLPHIFCFCLTFKI